jgi:hypothetical protein
LDPDSNPDPESDLELITDLEVITALDPDPNLQIISDPSGSGCITLGTVQYNPSVVVICVEKKVNVLTKDASCPVTCGAKSGN